MFATLALIAAVFEIAFGYSQALFRAAGHPVTWIGRLISRCERSWNRPDASDQSRRLSGVATVAVLLVLTGGAALLMTTLIKLAIAAPYATVIIGVLASTLLAAKSLDTHVTAVASALQTEGIAAAQTAVSQIVGRDVSSLDDAAVSRAAIESLAENFSDGVVAPLLWLAIAGLPGAAIYKAINTADSMIGHKNQRYLAFGWAAARLDDVINFPASRLSALWIAIAALITPQASAIEALRAVWRDAPRHRSPNAGWPEAAMAGALGLRLAGPRSYAGQAIDDHWMGGGRHQASAEDIGRALVIYRTAHAIQVAVLGSIAWLMI